MVCFSSFLFELCKFAVRACIWSNVCWRCLLSQGSRMRTLCCTTPIPLERYLANHITWIGMSSRRLPTTAEWKASIDALQPCLFIAELLFVISRKSHCPQFLVGVWVQYNFWLELLIGQKSYCDQFLVGI